jgi:hypothetical protein
MISPVNFKKLFFAVILMAFTIVNAEISSFVGNWMILEVYDTVTSPSPRELPTSAGPFIFKFLINEQNPSDTLNVSFKIGNIMRTTLKILDDDEASSSATIEVGLLMSTQMMPAQDQFQFEMFLSKALPKMTDMILDDAGEEMILIGDSKIVLQAVDTSDV